MNTYDSDTDLHATRRSARAGKARWLLATLALAANGCSSSLSLAPVGGYTLARGAQHPLLGQIIQGTSHRSVSSAQLLQDVERAHYLILGETHDNADQHQLQAQLLGHFLSAHPSASVGFEMLDEDDGALLAQHPVKTPETLAQLVEWDKSGWPEFKLYRPIFEVALTRGAPLLAAHPSAAHVRASMRGVDADEGRSLHIDHPLPDDQIRAQEEEIRESHCGHANAAMTQAMQHAQVYKDAFMARALLQTQQPTALITGRGHTRKDRAVPYFLARMQALPSLSVAFIDVDDAHTAATDYDIGAFDYVIFTPRVSDEDPCEEFRKQLEKMHQAPAPTPNAS